MPDTKIEFIESYIKHGNGDYEWNDNHGELIRCKDCKYYDGNGTCMKNGIALLADRWFCADGERQEGR